MRGYRRVPSPFKRTSQKLACPVTMMPKRKQTLSSCENLSPFKDEENGDVCRLPNDSRNNRCVHAVRKDVRSTNT